MDLVQQLETIAYKHFALNSENGPDDGGTFRTLTSFVVDGEEKPLLIVGQTSKKIEHGSCVIVLNPDPITVKHVKAGCHSLPSEKVLAERCDVLLRLWIRLNQPRIEIKQYYKTRNPQPGRIAARSTRDLAEGRSFLGAHFHQL